VDNGKFQSEIVKGVAISECGGEGMEYSTTTDTGGVISGPNIGDWNVSKSVNWLIRVSFKDYHKSPCPNIAPSDRWGGAYAFPMSPECTRKGRCWGYVKRALIYGGFKRDMGTGPACVAGSDLKRRGFVKIGTFTYQGGTSKEVEYGKQLGDIAIFNAQTGHKFGHAAMWCGKNWISDFKQEGNWISRGLTSTFSIWRYSGHGKNQGTA
jgi:hypothetical protein